MDAWVIRRINQGGGYLTPPGSERTWTKDARKAQCFSSHAAAVFQCAENEIPELLCCDQLPGQLFAVKGYE